MDCIHSSKSIIASKSSELAGKKIVLCVCGSVAACRAPELARELMRLGANVICVMSESAQKLVGIDLLWWATGEKPVIALTGACEHISLCGKHKSKADLILIAPATANTISKIACGIDDTPVTTVVSTAIGSEIPLVIVPAMHASLYDHPIVKENIETLERKLNVAVVRPRMEEGKAKIAENEEIVDYCLRALSEKKLKGKRVLVTAGATREFVDDIRFISNPSSGRMGIELARQAWVQGAEVALIHGHVDVGIPKQLRAVKTISLNEMRARVLGEKFDFVFMAAAPADFGVKKIEGPIKIKDFYGPQKRFGAFVGKIKSERKITLELQPLPKIAREIKRKNKNCKLILFKAESRVGDKELEKRAKKLLEECSADFVVANDVSRKGAGFEVETNEVLIVKRKGKAEKMKASKREIAGRIVELASG